MNTCRLCLRKGDNNQVIPLQHEEKTVLISQIKECVSIEITPNDVLPQTVCVSCIRQVKDWASFRETCLVTNEVLLVLYKNPDRVKKQIEIAFEVEEPDLLKSDIEEKEIKQEFVKQLSEDNAYSCEICSMEFHNCFEYLDHQMTHNGKADFKCDQCSEQFSTRQDLVEHDRCHSTQKQQCPKCHKFVLQNNMSLHLIQHTDRHMCNECQKRFSSRSALMQHVITRHTTIKNHVCNTCGKRFSSKTVMNAHLKSHSDERQYPCKLCDYAGRTASAVYVHMSTHANDTLICEFCSKIFKSMRNLNDHLRRAHGKGKKHKCSNCDKTFVDKYRLTTHLRCHTGVKPYPCHLCDKTFNRSDGLKEHLTTHGQRIWYECGDCGRKFTSMKSVSKHQCPNVS